MIHRIVQGLAFVFATFLALDAPAQTFVTPTALGAETDEIQRVNLPAFSEVQSAVETVDDQREADSTATEMMMAAARAPSAIEARDAAELSDALGRAIRAARRRPRGFEEQLDLTAAYPGIELPETDVGEAVWLATLANDRTRFEEFVRAAEPEVRTVLERRRTELLGRVAAAQADQKVTARVFADGTIRGTAEGTESPEGVGTGSLAVSLDHGNRLWYAAITVASTEDTLSDNFGAALLAPGSGKALSSGMISLLYHDIFATGFSFHPYLSSARHLWSIKDTARAATVLGIGALMRRDLGAQQVGGKDVSLAADLGLMGRFLGGDILDLSDDARDEGVGTSNTAFWGLETGATLSVGDLVGSVQLYYMFGKDDDRVLGLSNLQLVAGFSVKGELFRR